MDFPWLRTDIGWADVVVDTRLARPVCHDEAACRAGQIAHGHSWPTAEQVWTPQRLPDRFAADGFHLAGFSVSPYVAKRVFKPSADGLAGAGQDDLADRGLLPEDSETLSLLRLVHDDGWNAGFIFANHGGHLGPGHRRFDYAQVEQWLPFIGRRIARGQGGGNNDIRRVLDRLLPRALPSLRAFLDDPDEWYTHGRLAECDGEQLALCFQWASSAASFEDMCVLRDAGLDPVHDTDRRPGPGSRKSLLDWAGYDFLDPAEIVDWERAGFVTAPDARSLVTRYGVGRTTVNAWRTSFFAPKAWGPEIAEFTKAGWTRRGVDEIAAQIRDGRTPTTPTSFYDQVRAWLRLMPPPRACLYLAAGFNPRQAEEAEYPADGSEPPDDENLLFLAALRSEPTGDLRNIRVGEPSPPTYGAVPPRGPKPTTVAPAMGSAPKTARPLAIPLVQDPKTGFVSVDLMSVVPTRSTVASSQAHAGSGS